MKPGKPHPPLLAHPLLVTTAIPDRPTPIIPGIDSGVRTGVVFAMITQPQHDLIYYTGATNDGALSFTGERFGWLASDDADRLVELTIGRHSGLEAVIIFTGGYCSTAVRAVLESAADEAGLPILEHNGSLTRIKDLWLPRLARARRGHITDATADYIDAVQMPEFRDASASCKPRHPAQFHSHDAYVRDDFAEVFADGSCIRHEKSAAACAVADNGSWAAQPLRSAASSLAAELAAIGLAAKLARYSERSCVRIKSDSRQAIALIRGGLQGTDTGASLSGAEHRELVRTVDAIDKTDFVTIELAWTHGHAGTPRQEACDRAARFIARSFAWKLDEQVTDDRLADIISEEVRLRAA